MAGANDLKAAALRSTVADRLGDLLRQAILDAQFPAGAALREESLAVKHGVSRHLVREALRTLSAEGLVEYSPFKGARIPRLTPWQVKDIYSARRMIECSSICFSDAAQTERLADRHRALAVAVNRRAWRRAAELDAEFHNSIVALSSSGLAMKWHREAMQSLVLAHLVAPSFEGEDLNESVAQHSLIIERLSNNDPAGAAEALRCHLCDAEARLVQAVELHAQVAGAD